MGSFMEWFPYASGFVLFSLLCYGVFFVVKQKTSVVIERFGKYHSVRTAGLNLKIPILDTKAGLLNLRTCELPVSIETKTSDDVFVFVEVSIQYYIINNKEQIRKAFYELDDPDQQIKSYVYDNVRSEVPKLILDDVFSKKEEIAKGIKRDLQETIGEFGFHILNALVTDINPDPKVKDSMNEINAAKRLKEAAKEKAEADKIMAVKKAEAESESKKLQGEGIANQRTAIARGIKDSIQEVKTALGDEVSGTTVMSMLYMTQHYDTVAKLGEKGANTIFMNPNPSSVVDIQQQILSGIVASKTQEN
tara:strand:+ start:222 stop:1139 length:918 start_codon:yes stop_codon:yes gene_type:complete